MLDNHVPPHVTIAAVESKREGESTQGYQSVGVGIN